MTTSPQSETAAKKDVTKLQRAIVDGLEDVKGQNIVVFNTEHLSAMFERVVIASGIYLVHRERIAHRESKDAAMEQQAAS